MRRIIACLLTIIYLGFTAGAVAFEISDPASFFADKAINGYDINASNDDASDDSHVENINFHKVHKHLTASRTIKVPGVSFPVQASLIYISRTMKAYEKKPVNLVITQTSVAGLFIKNCVLRI